jgi:hypothetical protein
LAREGLLLLQLHGEHLEPDALAQIQNYTGDIAIIRDNLAKLYKIKSISTIIRGACYSNECVNSRLFTNRPVNADARADFIIKCL